MNLEAEIKQRLSAELNPSKLEIINESHLHVGHAGAKAGGKHFAVSICADKFTSLNKIARHRLIYKAVQDLMPLPLHALRIISAADK
jgi:BolA family transcriptional regulator, general stress-responsive regulator